MRLKKRSSADATRPCAPAPGSSRFRRRLQSIGVRVSDTNPDTRIAALIATANSWKRRPSSPPMKRTGMNTATREIVEAEPEDGHQGERPEERRRQRDGRDERGPEVPEEQEDDENDEDDREEERSEEHTSELQSRQY